MPKQNNHRALPNAVGHLPFILRSCNAAKSEEGSSMNTAHAEQSQTVSNECGIFIYHFPGIVKSLEVATSHKVFVPVLKLLGSSSGGGRLNYIYM
jgi:hypothetical protein